MTFFKDLLSFSQILANAVFEDRGLLVMNLCNMQIPKRECTIYMDSSPLLYYHISFNAWLPKLKCSTTAQVFLQSIKRDFFSLIIQKKKMVNPVQNGRPRFSNTLDQYHICFPVLEAWVRVVLEAG